MWILGINLGWSDLVVWAFNHRILYWPLLNVLDTCCLYTFRVLNLIFLKKGKSLKYQSRQTSQNNHNSLRTRAAVLFLVLGAHTTNGDWCLQNPYWESASCHLKCSHGCYKLWLVSRVQIKLILTVLPGYSLPLWQGSPWSSLLPFHWDLITVFHFDEHVLHLKKC